jgi:MSHA biogenesis protein MshO
MVSRASHSHYHSSVSGFTLMELVIVIVVLAIMGISLSRLTTNTVFGYIDAKDRIRNSQSSQWIIERISRELREALPQSVRVGVSGNYHCVEFMSIESASSYLNLPASGVINQFSAVGYDLVGTNPPYVAIMPINTANLYLTSGVLARISSIIVDPSDANQALINLASGTTFTSRSPQKRFYLLRSPTSFCLDDGTGQLFRYADYGVVANQLVPPLAGILVAENFSSNGIVFDFRPGSLNRSGLLQISLRKQNRNRSLSGNAESFEIFFEVHIRNVP